MATRSKATKTGLAFAVVAQYCRSRGYPEPEPEKRFHPVRLWRFDCAWDFCVPRWDIPRLLLAVEFQGGAFSRGHHTRGKGFSDDCEKLATAAAMGWRVLPVTTEQLNRGDLWPLLDLVFAGGR